MKMFLFLCAVCCYLFYGFLCSSSDQVQAAARAECERQTAHAEALTLEIGDWR